MAPDTRPLEELAIQARRLGRRFHHPPEGQRFEKCEAVRRAYDTVLIEASQALGVTTLLTVIAPGPELDIERDRVELALEEQRLRARPAALTRALNAVQTRGGRPGR